MYPAARSAIGSRFPAMRFGKRVPSPSRIFTRGDFSGAIDFRVGRPWGKTALLTGYSGRDLLFRPAVYEYYQTIAYAGLEHKFGSRIRASAVSEFLRSWRVEDNSMRSRKLCVLALARRKARPAVDLLLQARGLQDAAFTPMTM